MKKVLIGLLIALVCIVGISKSEAVTRVIGLQGQCDTSLSGCFSIPTTLTTLCTSSCAFRSSFSYTNSSRFWGANGQGTGACITSTDGGVTWVACTSQPFSTGANEEYAGASDGSVIAVGVETGPNTCTIRRSINNATSWTTVFTLVTSCNPNNLEGQYLYCLGDGRCELAIYTGGIGYRIIRSTDNGQNWIAESASTTPVGCSHAGSAWNGSGGINPSEDTGAGCGGAGSANTSLAVADVWAQSTFWDGSQGDCWGSVVYNGVGRVICFAATNYTMRDSAGALVANLTLPSVSAAIDSGGVAISVATNVLYLFASTDSGTTGVYVSRDNLVTFVKLGDVIGSMRGGNTFYANGCIYVTSGTTKRFYKVC